MDAVPVGATVQRLAFVAVVVVALVAVSRLDGSRGEWRSRLRRRFVFGVPWGTLVVTAGVLAVYLFLQDGWTYWENPTVLPYRAWSYGYPLGFLTAAFAHTGPGHLVSNLVGTLTLAPLAEYAFGHVTDRSDDSRAGAVWTNPNRRAFVVFPAAVLVLGVVTALFSLGPIIGFSGVVFAFAGFALVYYPLATVLALVFGRVLRVGYAAMLSPTTTAKARQVFVSPWWADVAIQGHALGLLVGVLLGLYLARRRDDAGPPALRLWTGVLLFGVSESMWAVYWFRGDTTFVLYRALGLSLVVLLATLVVFGAKGSDGSLLGNSGGESIRTMPRWQVGMALLLAATAALSGPAIPYNLVGPENGELPGQTLTVRDYEVTYAENVENGLTASFDIDLLGETTSVTTSGVVVQSQRRSIWTRAVSKGSLAFAGTRRVHLGGPGWRESVVVRRRGWTLDGGNKTYRVTLSHDGETVTAYRAPEAQAQAVIAGRTVHVVPTTEGFVLSTNYRSNRASAPIPARNATVTLQGVSFTRKRGHLFAAYNQTRVAVAKRETYKQ
jgi:membrane associated rhomboid family serine protease